MFGAVGAAILGGLGNGDGGVRRCHSGVGGNVVITVTVVGAVPGW